MVGIVGVGSAPTAGVVAPLFKGKVGDCDDTPSDIHLGAAEVVNGIDDDGDRSVDTRPTIPLRAINAPGAVRSLRHRGDRNSPTGPRAEIDTHVAVSSGETNVLVVSAATVSAGRTSGEFAVTPLAPGTATITATHAGVSRHPQFTVTAMSTALAHREIKSTLDAGRSGPCRAVVTSS